MNKVDIKNDRIFVSIASYRDFELRNTINDMFAKATFKHRVIAGVLNQVKLEEDTNLLLGNRTNVREVIIPNIESKGCTWARNYILTNIRKDEEFVLQVDAHTRFDVGWDVSILTEYSKLPKHDCVLTSYPPAFEPGKPLDTTPKHVFMKFRDIHYSGLPLFLADISSLKPHQIDGPTITPALSAGCLFGPSNIFDRVPYDPYVYFFGEEQSMAIRLYTHGIDLYCPQKTFIYHYYYDPEVNKIKKLHWSDINQKQLDEQKGLARVKYILNMTDHFPDENAIDIGKYSVGNIRSIAEWEAFSGFNLKTGEMTQLALNGLYKDL